MDGERSEWFSSFVPLLIRPSFLLTLHMNVGRAPGEGWGFTATLLLAFVFSDPLCLYLRAWQLSRERLWHLSFLQSSCAAHNAITTLNCFWDNPFFNLITTSLQRKIDEKWIWGKQKLHLMQDSRKTALIQHIFSLEFIISKYLIDIHSRH